MILAFIWVSPQTLRAASNLKLGVSRSWAEYIYMIYSVLLLLTWIKAATDSDLGSINSFRSLDNVCTKEIETTANVNIEILKSDAILSLCNSARLSDFSQTGTLQNWFIYISTVCLLRIMMTLWTSWTRVQSKELILNSWLIFDGGGGRNWLRGSRTDEATYFACRIIQRKTANYFYFWC